MKAIWKFPIYNLTVDRTDVTSVKPPVEMPIGATVLYVACQDGSICVWAEVETSEVNIERRDFYIYKTGQLMIESEMRRQYIGTFFLNEGAKVYHVFEIFHENATYPGYRAK
jgi:hypothetical protein